MVQTIRIEAEAREQAGKGAARATRRAGHVPAVIYGAKQEATLISLDPRIGRPVRHSLASVTVSAPDCRTADALATALFGFGPEEGPRWITKCPGVEALFIIRDGRGGFTEIASSGFVAQTAYRKAQ